jgi:F1F0 ATPase subunit 2
MDAQAMTHFDLTGHNLIGHLVNAGAWLACGALIGTFHFLTLRWNVRMFAAEQPLLLSFGIQLVRFALMAAVLAVITRSFGALPLLVVTVGILTMRIAVVRLGARG